MVKTSWTISGLVSRCVNTRSLTRVVRWAHRSSISRVNIVSIGLVQLVEQPLLGVRSEVESSLLDRIEQLGHRQRTAVDEQPLDRSD